MEPEMCGTDTPTMTIAEPGEGEDDDVTFSDAEGSQHGAYRDKPPQHDHQTRIESSSESGT